MNAIGRAARSAGSKAFAFNIFPAPANIAESREILRVLQSYGEVATYKLFKVSYGLAIQELPTADNRCDSTTSTTLQTIAGS